MVLTSCKLHRLNLMLVITLVATQQTMQMEFRYRMHVIYVKKKKENSVRDTVYMVYFPFKSILSLCIDTARCSSNKKLL